MATVPQPGTKTYREFGATGPYADQTVWDDSTDYDRLTRTMWARVDSPDLRSVLWGFIIGVSLDATLVNAYSPGDTDAAAGAANTLRWLERALTSEPDGPLPETADELEQLRARKRAEQAEGRG